MNFFRCEKSNEVLKDVDTVLVITGSVGIEAILQEKPVLTIGKPYFFFKDITFDISGHPSIDQIKTFIKKAENKYWKFDKIEFIRYLMNCHVDLVHAAQAELITDKYQDKKGIDQLKKVVGL